MGIKKNKISKIPLFKKSHKMTTKYVYQNPKFAFCSIVISTVSGDQQSYNEFPENFPFKYDDGDAFPRQFFYTNATFDSSTKTFKGTLDYCNKPAGNVYKWQHQFQFSEDMSCCIDGFAIGFDQDGKEKYKFAYGKPEPNVKIDCGLEVKSKDLQLDLVKTIET